MLHPHRRRLIPTQISAKLTGRDSQMSQRRDSQKHLCHPPALMGEKVFQRILSNAGGHHIPCCYVRNYCSPLPCVVRPLITKRDQRRTDDPLDLAIKLLDRDILRHICQETHDQWRTLFESSDCPTNPKCYWSLLCKLVGNRSSPPPNISIVFEGKTHSSLKAIAQAFKRHFIACSAQHNQALKRLMRDLHRHHRVEPS